MNARHVLLTFAAAFSLGILATVFLVRQPPANESIHAAAAPEDAAASPDDADAKSADDPAAKWPDDAGSPEQVMYSQAQLMDAAIAKVAARSPDKTNLYLIAFAGDGEENVFRNEAEYVERLFAERYDAIGHTLVLINNPATITQRPLASLSNLQTAVDAIADKMDGDRDVLLLFLTSHGSSDHQLYVALDPLPLDQIEPDDVADLFTDTKIRNKVVIVSACYSGGFIEPLKGPGTMVITAARADRTSFGCGTQSQITDFGRAFFASGLNDHDTFPAAFAQARKLIDEWETRAGEQHSEPQISTSPQIERRLKEWREGIHLGPAVPFDPAPSRAPAATATRTLTAVRLDER